MSQETQIGNLGGISDEDSKLVDSILNDINSSGQQQQQHQHQQQQQPPQQQQQQQQQQVSPEQMKMIQQRQMAAQQNQMAQQQQLHQQAQKMNMVHDNGNDVLENIKIEAKNIMAVIFLCILFNLDQVDNIFKSVSIFTGEEGGLNMQAVFIKALLIGSVFYIVKTYLL